MLSPGSSTPLVRNTRRYGSPSLVSPVCAPLELTINHSGPYAYDVCLGPAHLIVAELARTPHRRSKTLRPHALAKVREYISAYLPEKIYVSDLAAMAGMSRGRFAQSFRQSTGLTPHRYKRESERSGAI